MRLKVSRASAEESLRALIAEGYRVLNHIRTDYTQKVEQGTFRPELVQSQVQSYQQMAQDWINRVARVLLETFPSEWEAGRFLNPPPSLPAYPEGVSIAWAGLVNVIGAHVRQLELIEAEHLGKYTDLPLSDRLYVEDIDSFQKVRDVNPAAVQELLSKGFVDVSEDVVQRALERILGVPFHQNDWGGEVNDLYSSNLVVNGRRTSAAFLLKGNGLRKKSMELSDCGKNGNQVLRLFESPAEILVVQFVGNVSQSVIKDVQGKVSERRLSGRQAWFCIIDGQDTARLLRAYGAI